MTQDFFHRLMRALVDFLDALDADTLSGFENDKNVQPHSKEYYTALQDIRTMVREWRKFNGR